MPAFKSNGTKNALLVLDVSTKKQIALPLNAQEAILEPVVALRKWIMSRMRTAPNPKQIEIGGKVWYYAFPKQTKADREIQTTIDDTTGLHTSASMLGEQVDGSGTNDKQFAYIAPTTNSKLLKDYVELDGGVFLKHLFSVRDLEEQGLENLVQMTLRDFMAENMENNLVSLKQQWANAFGTMGKWATDAGHVLPTTGVGKRVQAKTYATADGLIAIEDIKAALGYKSKLGLKGGVEPTYPLARGMNIATSSIISLSAHINDIILSAVEKSANGFLAGVGIDISGGLVSSITYLGKKINVEVIDDAPQVGGKDFNWAIEEIGKNGAMAVPNVLQPKSIVRPHYEGVSLLGKILEGIGLVASSKFFQPELNFASFAA